MSLTDTLGRIAAGCATLFWVLALLFWFNYLALGGGVSAIYAALWGVLLGVAFLIATAVLRWV